jgi:hypothetical protein
MVVCWRNFGGAESRPAFLRPRPTRRDIPYFVISRWAETSNFSEAVENYLINPSFSLTSLDACPISPPQLGASFVLKELGAVQLGQYSKWALWAKRRQ